MPILGDFAVKYGSDASALGVPSGDLMSALIGTAENTVCNCLSLLFLDQSIGVL